MALRRFINCKGDVRQIHCDNDSNFVGADAEFKKAIKENDQEKINDFLLRNNMDWIEWDFNTPTASRMGATDSLLSFNPFIFVEDSLVSLTPNQLLTSKTKIVMPPPGTFTRGYIQSTQMEKSTTPRQ